jgi:hypothetical protein
VTEEDRKIFGIHSKGSKREKTQKEQNEEEYSEKRRTGVRDGSGYGIDWREKRSVNDGD